MTSDWCLFWCCREFISSNKDTVRELYYSRAVENGDGIFTFSVPLLEGSKSNHNNCKSTFLCL